MTNSREKGARGERQVKQLLKDWWECDFARTPGSGAFATITGMQEYAGDLRPVDQNEWFPFSVEVKNCEGWLIEDLIKSDKCKIWKYWEQCKEQASRDGKVPLLIFKRNRQPWWFMTPSLYLGTTSEMLTFISFFLQSKSFTITNKDSEHITIGLMEDLVKVNKVRLK